MYPLIRKRNRKSLDDPQPRFRCRPNPGL